MNFRVLILLLMMCVPALGQAEPPKILVLGDSLSAAYGIPVEQGWVALLQQRLLQGGYPQRVVNASVSGDTTSAGRARLAAAIRTYQPQIVLIELGGNDGLRGLKTDKMRDNLLAMVQLCQASAAKPLIFEMRVPENYGKDYTGSFTKTFSEVSRQTGAPLVPFFLGAFAAEPRKWFQDDGIHPIAAAQPKMLDAVWPVLKKNLARK